MDASFPGDGEAIPYTNRVLPATAGQKRRARPGDELRVESEVLEVRPSKSRSEQGLVKVKTTTLNQNGEPVQVFVGNLVVPRRRK